MNWEKWQKHINSKIFQFISFGPYHQVKQAHKQTDIDDPNNRMNKADLVQTYLLLRPKKNEKIQYTGFSKSQKTYIILQYIRLQRNLNKFQEMKQKPHSQANKTKNNKVE